MRLLVKVVVCIGWILFILKKMAGFRTSAFAGFTIEDVAILLVFVEIHFLVGHSKRLFKAGIALHPELN